MELSKTLTDDIVKAQKIVGEMIETCRVQKALNYDHLFVVNKALSDISLIIKGDKNKEFVNTWNGIIGSAHRIFEGHPLLDLLYNIDKQLKLK